MNVGEFRLASGKSFNELNIVVECYDDTSLKFTRLDNKRDLIKKYSDFYSYG